MSLKPKLAPRTSTSLTMTPQMQQAMKLLLMSNVEARAFIAEIAEQNPLVDLNSNLEGGAGATPVSGEAPAAYEGLPEAPRETARRTGAGSGGQPSDGRHDPLEQVEEKVSLREHLGHQIRLSRHSPEVEVLAHLIVNELDDDGYLRTPLFEIADRAGVVVDLVERALRAVQACAPAGFGARDLSECLALQLRASGRHDSIMRVLLERLDAVASGDVRRLAAETGADPRSMEKRLAILRRLDPKPGLRFQHAPVQTVIPDIIVRKAATDQWVIDLNPDNLPKVLIDSRYASTVSAQDRETRLFLSDCRRQVSWLSKALDQRARTILCVASEIVRRQTGFLEFGISRMQPLTLKAVADRLGMHESTVSRAAGNKYMVCPRGTFELKFFFTTGLPGGENGSGISSAAIRDRIRQLISNEKPDAVISDDRIAEILSREGVAVARRTVAKYREGMKIPSSVKRRQRRS
ncbi:MAG: RNA polymerase factor sigma-54 [Paracoccaceae bacterium]